MAVVSLAWPARISWRSLANAGVGALGPGVVLQAALVAEHGRVSGRAWC
jgi:hypothetical protein